MRSTIKQGKVGLQVAGIWRHSLRAYSSTQASRQVTRKATSTGKSGPTTAAAANKEWDIRMLYDGDCPLCMREVNMLRRRDKEAGKIDFVDISSPQYDPAANANISYEQAMGEIHAILPDGQIITNVEVFRQAPDLGQSTVLCWRLYEVVGLGWIYSITKIEPIGKAADWVYGIWAKYRMQVTGRGDFATVFAKQKSCKIQ